MTMYNDVFFRSWEKSLRDKIEQQCALTTFLPGEEALSSCCQEAAQASTRLEQAKKALEKCEKKQPPAPANEVQEAKKAVNEAKERLEECMATCRTVGESILEDLESSGLFQADFNDDDIVTLVALVQGKAERLAAWCQQGETQSSQLMAVLGDPQILRTWLEAGGPNNGEYGLAAEILSQLEVPKNESALAPVFQRLALAVSLELSGPLDLNPIYSDPIDPVQRYIHYEQAYLFGVLDPAFASFSVWEMRMIVNSDAPEEELSWARECLMNYRPDIVISNDSQWRYCQIVRTDVAYKHPEWYKDHRTYDQILSDGGMCGPRAWYGRFICKAFGIPTWGVRQPAHAAMSRWTTNGWKTCLGAGFDVSYWNEGRRGKDFELETQAREALKTGPDDLSYLRHVLRLEWMAIIRGESNKNILERMVPTMNCLWYALAMFQRMRIVSKYPGKRTPLLSYTGHTKVESLIQQPDVREGIVSNDKGRSIILPATSCSQPSQPTQNVLFMKSFLGGQQLFLWHSAQVEYTLSPQLLPAEPTPCKLILYLVTVHRGEPPLSLTVTSCKPRLQKNEVSNLEVAIPMTEGMWMETDPVIVTLECASQSTGMKFRFERKRDLGGIALKYIKLVPI